MSELEIAKLCQFNEKAEAQAVEDYTEMIKQVLASEIEETQKETIVNA